MNSESLLNMINLRWFGKFYITGQDCHKANILKEFSETEVDDIVYYTPSGYIVPMEFRVHFFPRISAFSRRTKMHLKGMLLIGTEFFKIIVPF